MANYLFLTYEAYDAGTDTIDLVKDGYKTIKKEGKYHDYGRVFIKGVATTSKVTSFVLKLKYSKGSLEPATVKKISKYLLVGNATALGIKIKLNLAQGKETLKDLQVWELLAQVADKVEIVTDSSSVFLKVPKQVVKGIKNKDHLPTPVKTYCSKVINLVSGIFRSPFPPSQLQNLAQDQRQEIVVEGEEIFSNLQILLQRALEIREEEEVTKNVKKYATLPFDQIPFDLRDLSKLNLKEKCEEEIPEEYDQNPVFKKFICPFTQKFIRYPVVVLDHNNELIKKPMQIFERMFLLEAIRNEGSIVYPNTQETIEIGIHQIREHRTIRKIIESELALIKSLD